MRADGSQPTNLTQNPAFDVAARLAAVMKCVLLACLALLVAPAAAHAEPVSDWNTIASTAIVTTAGQSAHASSLSYAMVQGAVYDAVNAIDRSHRPYLVSPPRERSDSKEAAVATAAFRVLVALFPAQLATLQLALRRRAGGDPGRPPQGRWRRRRRGGRGRHARRPRRRRPRRAVHRRARHRPGRLAPDAAELRARSRAVGGQRAAVRRPARDDPALRPAEPAGQRRLRARSQRGQAGGLAREHDAHRRPDRGGDLLAGPPAPDLEPRAAIGRGHLPVGRRRRRPAVRGREPGRRRRRDRLLAQQVPVELLAARHGDPRGVERRQPRHRRRPGVASAVRSLHAAVRPAADDAGLPGAPVGSRLRQRGGAGEPRALLRQRPGPAHDHQ